VQPLDSLNALSPEGFASAVQPLFEAAAPLATALYAERPFTSYAALIDTAERLTLAMSFADQVAVLSAHPPIGANAATVSQASYREQGYDREAGMDPAALAAVYAELAELNHVYEQRFGFRFVVFVNKRSKAEILSVLKDRLNNPPAKELRGVIEAMFQIARDRLSAQQH